MNAYRNLLYILLAVAGIGVVAVAPAVAGKEGETGGIGTDPVVGGDGETSKSAGVFPVRGRVTWGDGLGAGRGHRGQDLLAKCGKPVVAAQAGQVKIVDYQGSGAGNFVVIKSKKTKFDYVYMHMAKRASVSRGDRVDAGDQIGIVGTTGSSTACHLHFEMWTQPGWYRGGDVENPKPYLKAWDRSS